MSAAAGIQSAFAQFTNFLLTFSVPGPACAWQIFVGQSCEQHQGHSYFGIVPWHLLSEDEAENQELSISVFADCEPDCELSDRTYTSFDYPLCYAIPARGHSS